MSSEPNIQEAVWEQTSPEGILLLDLALQQVESQSLRDWANTAHNRPLWECLASGAVARGRSPYSEEDVRRFSTYLVCVGMGM